MNILITGGAGFIGYHLARAILMKTEHDVLSVDNMCAYYDVELKKARLAELRRFPRFMFIEGDLADKVFVKGLFKGHHFDVVVNLAAQAGVRYSIDHPESYVQSNIVGFFNVLEAMRRSGKNAGRLVFASSSSIYGANKKVPYSVSDKTDKPVSLYAATKKADELIAHAYAKLYGIPMTGLRFFTVYGPYGRPDMAYFKFTDLLVEDKPIEIYNNGDMYRDFTYIDDVVACLMKVIMVPPKKDEDGIRFRIYNVGNSEPVRLTDFVALLEDALMKEGIIRKRGRKIMRPMQPGDVYTTCADVGGLARDFGYRPSTPLREGLAQFARWYRTFYPDRHD